MRLLWATHTKPGRANKEDDPAFWDLLAHAFRAFGWQGDPRPELKVLLGKQINTYQRLIKQIGKAIADLEQVPSDQRSWPSYTMLADLKRTHAGLTRPETGLPILRTIKKQAFRANTIAPTKAAIEACAYAYCIVAHTDSASLTVTREPSTKLPQAWTFTRFLTCFFGIAAPDNPAIDTFLGTAERVVQEIKARDA